MGIYSTVSALQICFTQLMCEDNLLVNLWVVFFFLQELLHQLFKCILRNKYFMLWMEIISFSRVVCYQHSSNQFPLLHLDPIHICMCAGHIKTMTQRCQWQIMERISTPFKVSFWWTSTSCFLCNLMLRPITHHRRYSKWHLLCPHTANVTHVVLSSSERRLNRSAPTDGSTSLNGNTQLAPFVLCRLSPSQPPSSYHSLPRLSVTLHWAPLPHYLPTPSVTYTNRHMRWHEWVNMLNFVQCSCVSASPSPSFSLPPCLSHTLSPISSSALLPLLTSPSCRWWSCWRW